MSIFHFPRINFKGLITANQGTANNDDYSSVLFPKGSPYAGQPVRLTDSKTVQPLTYGMTDAEWITWAQAQHDFTTPASQKFRKTKADDPTADGTVTPLIPAEWNYYGNMGMTMINNNVVGITDPDNVIPQALKVTLQQATLSFNNSNGFSTGLLIDVNPEDANCSQIFADFLTLTSGTTTLFSGKPTKGITRWINFQRNTQLSGPNGASGTIQMAVPLSALQGQPILQALPKASPEGAALIGLVCRFTLFRSMQVINTFKYQGQAWFDQMKQLYKTQGTNASYLQIQGTIAPWFEGEPESCPVGRQLATTGKTIPVPDSHGNGPAFVLAPAMAHVDKVKGIVSVDCSATFPDAYQVNAADPYNPNQTDNNPKFDFGALNLVVQDANNNRTTIGAIDYSNTQAGDEAGWLFDLPYDAKKYSDLSSGDLILTHEQYGDLLQETPYFLLSDQSGVYAEQGKPGSSADSFRNDGKDTVPVSFIGYKRGKQFTKAEQPLFTLYFYDTTPNQEPGKLELLQDNYSLGSPITLTTGDCGNRLITIVPKGSAAPPESYGDFNSALAPLINVRILPNYEDYSKYYNDPHAAQPTGNATLTFNVIFEKVLHNYYLIYPAMNKVAPLNDQKKWSTPQMAEAMITRVSLDTWGTSAAMPRTRDLSESRRTLLTAWCLKVLEEAKQQPEY